MVAHDQRTCFVIVPCPHVVLFRVCGITFHNAFMIKQHLKHIEKQAVTMHGHS
uniref:Uncharacterized protein n=1 Tax=Arundo donax TaxID=35708 RepID=A0A0A9VGX1_ARUDO